MTAWCSYSFFLAGLVSLTGAQMIFIDNVPGYAQLNSCAEQPLSQGVRDMSFGCGFGTATTSITCLCGTSSSVLTSHIAKAVLQSCPSHTDDVSSALSVFAEYCKTWTASSRFWSGTASLTVTEGVAAATALPSSSASNTRPSQTVSTSTSAIDSTSSTPTSSSTASVPTTDLDQVRSGLTREKTIIIAVMIPLAVFWVGGAAMFIYVHRKNRLVKARAAEDAAKFSGSLTSSPDRSPSPPVQDRHAAIQLVELENSSIANPTRAELRTDGRYGNGTRAHELVGDSSVTAIGSTQYSIGETIYGGTSDSVTTTDYGSTIVSDSTAFDSRGRVPAR